MLQTANRQAAIRALKGKLLAAYEYLIACKDQENGNKVKELAGKLLKEEFAIAFCGHFSAGKSTIINRLIGEELLPSSPIPTSANLVKVKSGEEYAKVVFKNEKPRMYLAPYDYEMVKRYCKDGDQIREIEISHAESRLPERTVILDTPGIDSADDAHRIATESAIHLADLIFYVMDYNHVQSELNFMFTKELSEAGKEVYLVINQVDKHSKQELSFEAFRASVTEAFTSWGVTPAHVFYTSLKQDEHEYNQFPALQEFLAERLQEKDALLLQSILKSLQKILKDHFAKQKEAMNLALEPSREILNELSVKEQTELAENYNSLLEEKKELGVGVEAAEREFDAEMAKILGSAYLMRFETRALAEAYLESCQVDFKVGWLFTKQKTLEERERRLNLFYQELFEKTKSQLEWHLRDFLLRFAKERRLESQALLERLQGLTVHFSSGLLSAAVKDGARVSGTTVINYTDSVATEIKLLAKSAALAYKEELLQTLKAKNAAVEERLAQKSAGMERYLGALEEVRKCESALAAKEEKIQTRLEAAGVEEEDCCQLFEAVEEACEVVSGETVVLREPRKKASAAEVAPLRVKSAPLAADASGKMKDTAKRLQQTARLVKDLPGFHKLAEELVEKASRLENKGFSVALFGAFSAGKSSFANALIGERVLPVSPNPTTAAINKIKPVDAENPHGTVRIKLKEEQAMLEDVNHALKLFESEADSLSDALGKVETISGQSEQQGAAEKTNLRFLQAFVRGYAALGERLGGVLETTLEQFSDYVALEEKSCFVEWVDLYYDCPLTRKGITLVDTPGADSINVRHTGVAFDFIKNSDAILFVTYYNHAFSKADREFLIQLGRVKDAFQLDKMFFIINAIDLAAHDEEQELVVAYVEEQLIKYGVRNPHLYPLSSLNALQEKEEAGVSPSSGMAAFEEAFYHFISDDLANLTVAASEKELSRVAQFVAKLIESSKEDASVKDEKRKNIEAEKAAMHALLAQQSAENCKNRLCQEAEVLVYYIKQRVFLRFNDFFRDAFNPSVLRDDGRNLKKVLQHALDELREELGFEFAQELRATTVRLDRFGEKIIAEQQMSIAERLADVNADVSFSLFENTAQVQMEFVSAFQNLPQAAFAKALSCFKNPKAFFEKQENKIMSEEMQRVLSAAADEYLAVEQKRLQDTYGTLVQGAFGAMITQMTEQADDFYLSLLSALDGGVPAETLLEIQQRLREM
ncbi:dynamin family protein [Azotosporobacter soli]|uniref:dynamin family protein n=1 Tax=Azotosporobacter soli TaxID=3055040 RepID=UPI0031FEA4DB